jgi:mono/diheme cytochrome c family protein
MLYRTTRIAISIGATTIALGLVVTAASADPINGERLARRWCASCHVVTPDQTRAAADAPSFIAIARSPGFDRHKIAFFLLDPHPKMPDMSLTRSEAADLADYIAKLQ